MCVGVTYACLSVCLLFRPIDPEEIKGRLLEHLNEQLQASEAHLRAELANKVSTEHDSVCVCVCVSVYTALYRHSVTCCCVSLHVSLVLVRFLFRNIARGV